VTIHAAACATRSTRSNGSIGWVPIALVALVVIPVIAGSLTKGRMPATYHLRVEGHLDQYWAPWFGDLTLTQESDGTTSFIGVISDQAELHGMLIRIRDLGVTLISVALVEPPTRVDPQL
jgi:hypothetical protein